MEELINGSQNFTEEVLQEIEAIKSIYENDVSVSYSNNEIVKIELTQNEVVVLEMQINGQYPNVAPAFKSDFRHVIQHLNSVAEECIGIAMLYTLLSQACDVLHEESLMDDQSKDEVKKEKNSKSEKQKLKKKGKVKESEEDRVIKKKQPMRTAIDVINRILWDDSLPTENFSVGYLDRFLGVLEKPFSAFSWEDISSVDYNVLAIPKHRIQYFRFKDVKIWDKNERFDYVFGSTGHDKSLMNIMEEDALNDDKKSSEGREEIEEREHANASKVYDNRNRPNYFLCLPISDLELIDKLKKVQHHIVSCDDRLEPGLIQNTCFHITLFMMKLDNERDKLVAESMLKQLEPLLVCMFGKSLLTVKNVDSFGGLVVYGSVEFHAVFHKFVGIAKAKFKDAGISLVGNYEPYTPHVTIMKLRRPMSQALNMQQISPFIYKQYENMSFGQQPVNCLRMCSTAEQRGDDEFYVTIASISRNLLCISEKLPSLIGDHVTRATSKGLFLEDVGDEYVSNLFSNDCDLFEKTANSLEKHFLESDVNPEKLVLILRGLPGSGKTHFARRLVDTAEASVNVAVCSADSYFQSKSNDYQFSGAEIDNAHQLCRDKFIDAIGLSSDVIIVDNSHTEKWEYEIYQRIAMLCGYMYHVLEIPCRDAEEQRRFQRRCEHKVAQHVHEAMFTRWEPDSNATRIDPDRLITMKDVLEHNLFPIRTFPPSLRFLYSALYLDEASKSLLLSEFPAYHSVVSGDHMTIQHAPTFDDVYNLPIGSKYRLKVTGYVNNRHVQVLAVQELDFKLCTLEYPHVTISRDQKTPAREAQTWLCNDSKWRPLKEIVLSGVVGVQIATSKTTSKMCVDIASINHQNFSSNDKKDDFTKKRDKSSGGSDSTTTCVVSSSQTYPNKQHLHSKKKREKKSKEEAALQQSNSNPDAIDAGMYFGPRIVKSLYVFDFDGTLFHTPDPSNGRNDYKRLTGSDWPHLGWLGRDGSLHYPLQVLPGPSLRDYFEHNGRACSMSVLLTGRVEKLREAVQAITEVEQMTFSQHILKPAKDKQGKKVYGGNSVFSYKKDYVSKLLNENKDAKEVHFWDDRIDNVNTIESLRSRYPEVKFNTYHVEEKRPVIYEFTPDELLNRMGKRPSAVYLKAAADSISYISKCWMKVLRTAIDQTENIRPFGSYPLMRRSDIDLVILAPMGKSVEAYMKSLGDELKSFGIRYISVETNIRCPRIKVKFEFLETAPIECDIVIATVLNGLDEPCVDDIESLHKRCHDKVSKIALNGLLFFEKIKMMIEEKISLEEFGMLVDLVCVLLQKNYLKGNAFHCIRTMHIVDVLSKFINNTKTLPFDSFSNMKAFENVFLDVMRYFSNVTFAEWKTLFNNFVPDSFVEPIRECFKHGCQANSNFLNLLFSAPSPNKKNKKIRIDLECADDISLWRAMVLLKALLGKCIRQIIDSGFDVYPGLITDQSITFGCSNTSASARLLKNFIAEFEKRIDEGVKVHLRFKE